ncbi:MAG: hypothetical protein AAB966_04070, partial [Patescibacteria group bacterium]
MLIFQFTFINAVINYSDDASRLEVKVIYFVPLALGENTPLLNNYWYYSEPPSKIIDYYEQQNIDPLLQLVVKFPYVKKDTVSLGEGIYPLSNRSIRFTAQRLSKDPSLPSYDLNVEWDGTWLKLTNVEKYSINDVSYYNINDKTSQFWYFRNDFAIFLNSSFNGNKSEIFNEYPRQYIYYIKTKSHANYDILNISRQLIPNALSSNLSVNNLSSDIKLIYDPTNWAYFVYFSDQNNLEIFNEGTKNWHYYHIISSLDIERYLAKIFNSLPDKESEIYNQRVALTYYARQTLVKKYDKNLLGLKQPELDALITYQDNKLNEKWCFSDNSLEHQNNVYVKILQSNIELANSTFGSGMMQIFPFSMPFAIAMQPTISNIANYKEKIKIQSDLYSEECDRQRQIYNERVSQLST